MQPRLAKFRYGSTDTPKIVTVLELRQEVPSWSTEKRSYLHAVIIWPDGRYGLVEVSNMRDIGPVPD